jgi:hypothetical protein
MVGSYGKLQLLAPSPVQQGQKHVVIVNLEDATFRLIKGMITRHYKT